MLVDVVAAEDDRHGHHRQQHDGRPDLQRDPLPARRIDEGGGEQAAGQQPADMRLPGDLGSQQQVEPEVEHHDGDQPPAVHPQPPGHHEPGAEQAEDGAGRSERRLGDRREVVVDDRPAYRADQVHGEIADRAEGPLQRGAHHDQRPHVEDDVERAEVAHAGRWQERRGDQPVPLAGGHPHERAVLAEPAEAEHLHVVGQPGRTHSTR